MSHVRSTNETVNGAFGARNMRRESVRVRHVEDAIVFAESNLLYQRG